MKTPAFPSLAERTEPDSIENKARVAVHSQSTLGHDKEIAMTTSAELLHALSDEADLCRNDGADDIAQLLDLAHKAISVAETYFNAKQSAYGLRGERRNPGLNELWVLKNAEADARAIYAIQAGDANAS